MIPPAQFDPATLAIWTTTVSLGGEGPEIADAVMGMASRGEDPVPIINRLPEGHPLRSRLVWLVSSVWHEKRHYFDTCFTNYGARRFRDLFTLAANVGPLLADANDRGVPVWFPVEVYGYPPGLRKVFGIPDPPENISRMAALARSMKSLMTQLDAAPEEGSRSIELGGAAQMEGLAQITQAHAVEYYFGFNDLHDISKEFIHKLPRDGPYRAIESVAGALGCSKTVGDAVYVNTTLAAALFMSALCGRFLGAGPQPDRELIAPWPRLARMIEELGPTPGDFDMTDEQAAEMVDKVALKLWGRTAFEEIASDIDLMEERVDLIKAPWIAEDGLYDAYRDFIGLRRRMLSAARDMGPAGVLPRTFTWKWLNELKPWHIVANPNGVIEAEDSVPVFEIRFDVPAELEALYPSQVIWGRAYLLEGQAAGEFAPRQRDAWFQMIERHAPYALLMLNGRRHRRMLAPELDRPLRELEELGIPVRFHPRFEWPEMRDQKTRNNEALTLSEFSGRKSFTCDITGEEIEPAMAAVLTPWEFRRSKLLERFRKSAETSEFMLMTNWSDWVVRRDLL